jgi:hypothetical protein
MTIGDVVELMAGFRCDCSIPMFTGHIYHQSPPGNVVIDSPTPNGKPAACGFKGLFT